MSETPLGRFCWHELMTPEPKSAREFYGRVVGWTTSTWEGGEDPYEMWMNGETPVGGVMGLPSPDTPPCWLAYVSTPDLDATLATVRDAGGEVMVEMSVEEVGRFAVLGDPQGGVIAVLEPEGETPGHDGASLVGEFSWRDLPTTDMRAALAFYTNIFGWEKTEQMDMGDSGIYQMFGRAGRTLGGIFNGPEEMPAVGWLPYVRVQDAATAAATVEELGGRVLNGPMEVPGGGEHIAHCMDPHGIAFAVHSVSRE